MTGRLLKHKVKKVSVSIKTEENHSIMHVMTPFHQGMALFFFGPDVLSFPLAAVHPSACLINPTTCHHILSPVYCLSSPQGRRAVRPSYLMFPLVTRFPIKWKTSVNRHTPCASLHLDKQLCLFTSCIQCFIRILLLNQVDRT